MSPAVSGLPSALDYQVHDVVAGRYRVEAVIGRGGAGTVYRAQALGMNYAVALKVMHERDLSGVDQQRFEREAKLAQKLRHQNAVQILDMGYLEDARPYIVYELLEGRSLLKALRQDGPFHALRVTRISLDVVNALVVAHDAGIVHRDIKPANIFLARTRTHGEVAKLLDLGLAAAPDDDEQGAPLTLTGHRLGTPRYMSPEMARGQKAHAQSDLYSLALVMAEMLTARPVLESKLHIELLMAHASDDAHKLEFDVLDSALYPLIERGLAKDLTVRYRTAVQLRADLEALFDRIGDDEDHSALGDSADLMPTKAVHARDIGFDPAEWVPASSSQMPPSKEAIPPPPSATAVRKSVMREVRAGSPPPSDLEAMLPALSSLPPDGSLPPAGDAFALPGAGAPSQLPGPTASSMPPAQPAKAAASGASVAPPAPGAEPGVAPAGPQIVRVRRGPSIKLFVVVLLLLAAAAGVAGYFMGG